MRRFPAVLTACAALLATPAAAETFVQCDVKLALPGGRLEARLFGDGKRFRNDGEATLIVPVGKGGLVADPPHAFDLTDPAGQTAEYRVHLRYAWIGPNPPPPFSKAGARHPWWPVGDLFVGPPLPASATPDKDWTYVAWGANGVQVKSGNYIYMTSARTPHRAEVGLAYERSDNEAEAARNLETRVAFIKALSAGDSFMLIFLNRANARLGAAQVDSALLKALPDLSDRAFEEAARMHKAGKCLVKAV
ncbi:MAG: hypothetical protein EON95_02515 [Caulobacteraceae bacterium]|nr:MAG: hypothetical protein EON95_02515 [Caulobacteraceae bacterium]